MKTFLIPALCASLFALAACESTPDATEGAAAAPAAGGAPASTVPGSLDEQLAALAPDEQRAYIAALTVRDGCLQNRGDIGNAVDTMVTAGFEPASITNVPDMEAANSGSLRIYTDTNATRGPRNLCAVDLPLESFDKFVQMIDAMVAQNFPGAERGQSGEKPAWKLTGSPETFIVADNAIDGGDGGGVRMGAITFVAR